MISIIAFRNAISADGRIFFQFNLLSFFSQLAESNFALFARCFHKIAFSQLNTDFLKNQWLAGQSNPAVAKYQS